MNANSLKIQIDPISDKTKNHCIVIENEIKGLEEDSSSAYEKLNSAREDLSKKIKLLEKKLNDIETYLFLSNIKKSNICFIWEYLCCCRFLCEEDSYFDSDFLDLYHSLDSEKQIKKRRYSDRILIYRTLGRSFLRDAKEKVLTEFEEMLDNAQSEADKIAILKSKINKGNYDYNKMLNNINNLAVLRKNLFTQLV